MEEFKRIGDMTPAQYKVLLKEYFAPDEKRSKMTDEEIKELAQQLNKKINVPLINELKEEKIFIKIVLKIDRFLYDNLPNEFYDLVRSLEGGIEDKEAKRLIKRLSQLANKKIDIPYIPEQLEYVAIRFIIGLIINAARKKWNLKKAQENALQMHVPNNENATPNELEGLII
ncbi:MAG: hypothetical protein JKY48_16130 [Flavobacteriales bacterium]|nr:hypothetical protein [Flavobacteriales bacterium]